MIKARTLPPTSLIPVLVTGTQPRRVRAVNDASRVTTSPASKDLGALASCDRHRNEGSVEQRRAGRAERSRAGRLAHRNTARLNHRNERRVTESFEQVALP
ncbi:hypothetical protein F4695_002382 [Rhizobium soli]|uniref:Uncharacterized protein n=1 Tax=Rhizobium soli TaxID=424798 RepID=A0A7X0JKS4_9HYPH|nr:hypothetical protein [Rhizobium soli]